MQENQEEKKSSLSMPIKVKPYDHQLKAFIFALQVMGFIE